jgi:hypothetical protein
MDARSGDAEGILAAKVADGVLRPVAPVILMVGNETVATYAMFDTGSNCDAIVPLLVRKLNMKPEMKPKTVITFGRVVSTAKTCHV